jgi:hypothetical protein
VDAFDRLLPIATLLLGSLLTWFLQRSDTAVTRRVVAGETLAELHRHIWTKGGDDDWLGLQVYLGTLRVRLRAAGVPDGIGDVLRDAAEEHWRAIEYASGAGWILLNDDGISASLDSAENAAYRALLPAWRRGLAAIRRSHGSTG